MDTQLYSDALGFAILQQANRFFEWTPAFAQWILLLLLALGAALTVAILVLRDRVAHCGRDRHRGRGRPPRLERHGRDRRRRRHGIDRTRTSSDALSHPFTWVDDHTGGKRDALPRTGRRRPDARVAARVLEPIDPTGHRASTRRSAARAPRRAEHHSGRACLLDARSPNDPVPATGLRLRGRGLAVRRLRRHARRDARLPRGRARSRSGGWCSSRSRTAFARRAAGSTRTAGSADKDSTYFRFVAKQAAAGCASDLSRQNWGPSPVHIELGIASQPSTRSRSSGRSSNRDKLHRRVEQAEDASGCARRRAASASASVVDKKFVPRESNPRASAIRARSARSSTIASSRRSPRSSTGEPVAKQQLRERAAPLERRAGTERCASAGRRTGCVSSRSRSRRPRDLARMSSSRYCRGFRSKTSFFSV